MATRPARITDEVVARLQTVSGLNVYRARTTPVTQAESPAAIVRMARDDVGDRRNDQLEREFTVDVLIVTRGNDPDELAETQREAIHAALMSTPFPQGMVLRVEPSRTTWETESADADACVVSAQYRFLYRTHFAKLDAERSDQGS